MGTFGTKKISIQNAKDMKEQIAELKKAMIIYNIKPTTPDRTDTNKWFIVYGEWKYS